MVGNELKVTRELYRLHRDKADREFEAMRHQQAPKTKRNRREVAYWSSSKIHEDVIRTFGSVPLFNDQGGVHYRILSGLLLLWWSYRRDVGFVQGMSYPTALIVLVYETNEYAGFKLLANLFSKHHFFVFYQHRGNQLDPYYDLFTKLLKSHASHSSRVIARLGVHPNVYLYKWFQPVFCQHLPLQCALRVFDNFLYHGVAFMYRVAIAIVRLLTPALEQAEDDFAASMILKRRGDAWRVVTEKALFMEIDRIQLKRNVYNRLYRLQQRDNEYV